MDSLCQGIAVPVRLTPLIAYAGDDEMEASDGHARAA
jgi:hypothetical protein